MTHPSLSASALVGIPTHVDLPTHATLRHPRTGQPLRAIGFRPDGTPLWPLMGAAPDDDDHDDDGDDGDDDTDDDQDDDDDGDQDDDDGDEASKLKGQLAETKRASRRWEKRAKANKAKADKYDQLQRDGMSDVDKRVADAKREAKVEAGRDRAADIYRAQIAAVITDEDEQDDILDDLNLGKFVDDDGQVDRDAIRDSAKKITRGRKRRSSDDEDDDRDDRDRDKDRRRTRDRGQGRRSRGSKTGGVAAGRARFQERHGKKDD